MTNHYDELAALRRRRNAAVRIPGGDPLAPGNRYHRPTIGHRASGYRDGYAAALRWVMKELQTCDPDLLVTRLTIILTRSEQL